MCLLKLWVLRTGASQRVCLLSAPVRVRQTQGQATPAAAEEEKEDEEKEEEDDEKEDGGGGTLLIRALQERTLSQAMLLSQAQSEGTRPHLHAQNWH